MRNLIRTENNIELDRNEIEKQQIKYVIGRKAVSRFAEMAVSLIKQII